MHKNDIVTRDDLYLLVTAFYKEIRKDEILGPIFNNSIKDWEHHLQLITNFWETSLLGIKTYKGDPFITHQKVDKNTNNTITMLHFGIWLNLWSETVDTYFKGEIANMAKRRARKMSSFMFIKIFEGRN